ncbi:hypothetical protein FA13DRAFT_1803263 [Coprinellus micaceus]|uniref:Uncharacterized protein n=1 Tax=Coprinellus micaceus TaxID=71717 RepID=A0A4Y7SAV1_COPMI|nr:hypothetical protein FA13DRAFT_1803263 [Coprinellus micaceus]
MHIHIYRRRVFLLHVPAIPTPDNTRMLHFHLHFHLPLSILVTQSSHSEKDRGSRYPLVDATLPFVILHSSLNTTRRNQPTNVSPHAQRIVNPVATYIPLPKRTKTRSPTNPAATTTARTWFSSSSLTLWVLESRFGVSWRFVLAFDGPGGVGRGAGN